MYNNFEKLFFFNMNIYLKSGRNVPEKFGDIPFILLKISGRDCPSPKGHTVHGTDIARDRLPMPMTRIVHGMLLYICG
jgi:hypothetical protein